MAVKCAVCFKGFKHSSGLAGHKPFCPGARPGPKHAPSPPCPWCNRVLADVTGYQSHVENCEFRPDAPPRVVQTERECPKCHDMIGIKGYGIHVKFCLGLPRSKRAGKPNPIQWPAVLAPPRKNFHNKLVSALGVPRVLQTIAAYVPAGPVLLGSLCRRARELLVALEPEKEHAQVDSASDNGDWMFEDVFAADLSAEGGGGC